MHACWTKREKSVAMHVAPLTLMAFGVSIVLNLGMVVWMRIGLATMRFAQP